MYYYTPMNVFTDFRQKHNLTQDELADLMFTTQGAISHIEQYRRKISLCAAKKFQKVANDHGDNISLDYIFSHEKT